MKPGLQLLGYTRVSTGEQAASGHGLAAQEASIRQACGERGWSLIKIERDAGESAGTLKRPALSRALTAIAHGEAAGLVVAKLDRLSRSVPDFGMLVEWFEEPMQLWWRSILTSTRQRPVVDSSRT